ncbi:hypothetical protein D7Y06_02455 [Roseburia sp. 1XD42-69]|nr:hypothetical protein D7Y06_02455 [Roseburia sp. 1XD42-69]
MYYSKYRGIFQIFFAAVKNINFKKYKKVYRTIFLCHTIIVPKETTPTCFLGISTKDARILILP